MLRFLVILCPLVMAAALLQANHYLPLLPEKTDLQLETGGSPLSLPGKEILVMGYLGLQAYILIFGLLIVFLIEKIPVRYINIPHRHYWLSPPQRAQSLLFLKEFFLGGMVFAGIFVAGLMEAVFLALLKPAPALPPALFHLVLGVCILCPLVGYSALYLRFRRPDPRA